MFLSDLTTLLTVLGAFQLKRKCVGREVLVPGDWV